MDLIGQTTPDPSPPSGTLGGMHPAQTEPTVSTSLPIPNDATCEPLTTLLLMDSLPLCQLADTAREDDVPSGALWFLSVDRTLLRPSFLARLLREPHYHAQSTDDERFLVAMPRLTAGAVLEDAFPYPDKSLPSSLVFDLDADGPDDAVRVVFLTPEYIVWATIDEARLQVAAKATRSMLETMAAHLASLPTEG
ncbi:MAG: hypothetical protein EOP84_15515 [Verrucomicrobiaceae bacterium]|nr:MAG: hypothetical protein EOP84_15515 [Verrucomicrobiaceae bacterium]